MLHFKAKMHKIDFGSLPAPNPAGESYSAPLNLLAGINRTYF